MGIQNDANEPLVLITECKSSLHDVGFIFFFPEILDWFVWEEGRLWTDLRNWALAQPVELLNHYYLLLLFERVLNHSCQDIKPTICHFLQVQMWLSDKDLADKIFFFKFKIKLNCDPKIKVKWSRVLDNRDPSSLQTAPTVLTEYE